MAEATEQAAAAQFPLTPVAAPQSPASARPKTGTLKIPQGYRRDLLTLALCIIAGGLAWLAAYGLMVSEPAIGLFGAHDILYLAVFSGLLLVVLFGPVTTVLILQHGFARLRRAFVRAAIFAAVYGLACLLFFEGLRISAAWGAIVALVAAGASGGLAVMVLGAVREARRAAILSGAPLP